MSFTEIKRIEIKKYLLRKIDEDDSELITKVADSFGISVTSVRRYIESLLVEKSIKTDTKKKCGYRLVFSHKKYTYSLGDISENEDMVMFNDIMPILQINNNAGQIWVYALSEITNNAIEHSEGKNVFIAVDTCCLYSRITVADDGVGIFKKVLDTMKKNGQPATAPECAVVELYKGKFTSKPENHSGEGIFFTMKLVDKFAIISDNMILRSGYCEDPSIIKSHLISYAMKFSNKGTVVMMELSNESSRKAADIFNTYSDVDEGFLKTKIPIFEACLDHEPVSRSQARRILARLESFKEVILDFEKMEYMSQGFADEMFRVFPNAHPDTKLTPVNMNAEVRNMYLYALHTKVEAPKF